MTRKKPNILLYAFGLIFFGAQIFGILKARQTGIKYFCWGPYDEIAEYEIAVEIDGVFLTDQEILKRYRKRARGIESRSINNLKSIIRKYERTYGKDELANVNLEYLINQHRRGTWSWPNDQIE